MKKVFFIPKSAQIYIDSGLYEKVCPVINHNQPRLPQNVYAANNPNEEIRMQSSSGGIFTMLAEKIIDEGGVVFGVGFNSHWEAVHSYTETKKGINAFRMSKYVQSVVGNTFKEAEKFLKQGRKVLYSETPCQIAGLRKFLRKEYNNILCIDFICHGTPSPGVFRWYIREEISRIACKGDRKLKFNYQSISHIPKIDNLASEHGLSIQLIKFRDKKDGWKNYRFTLELTKQGSKDENEVITLSYPYYECSYLRGFLRNLYLRPSCYYCPSKGLSSGSDITIGDYWGIEQLKPEIDDNKGISAIVVNSDIGNAYINQLSIKKYSMSYDELCRFNPSIIESEKWIKEHDSFFQKNKNSSFFRKINRYCDPSLKQRVKRKLKKIIKEILHISGLR